jgi:hypothetical protein
MGISVCPMVGDRELLERYGDHYQGKVTPEFERLRLKGYYHPAGGAGWFMTDHAKRYLKTFKEKKAAYGPGSAHAR